MLAVGYGESGVVGIYEYATDSGLRRVTATGQRVTATVAKVREQRRVRSCFAACVLLCALVAALRRTEKPLLSACCHAAALLCLATLPPVNKRASVRRRC